MSDYVYLIAPVMGWAVAQSIKFTLSLRKDGINWSDALQSGGMPSSHAAFMVSICTVVVLANGLKSVEFGILAAITAIILYDSLGVRKTTGDQTKAIDELAKHNQKPLKTKITDSKGHNIKEVIAGILVGIVVGAATYYIFV